MYTAVREGPTCRTPRFQSQYASPIESMPENTIASQCKGVARASASPSPGIPHARIPGSAISIDQNASSMGEKSRVSGRVSTV